jgi:hypothetical protein
LGFPSEVREMLKLVWQLSMLARLLRDRFKYRAMLRKDTFAEAFILTFKVYYDYRLLSWQIHNTLVGVVSADYTSHTTANAICWSAGTLIDTPRVMNSQPHLVVRALRYILSSNSGFEETFGVSTKDHCMCRAFRTEMHGTHGRVHRDRLTLYFFLGVDQAQLWDVFW